MTSKTILALSLLGLIVLAGCFNPPAGYCSTCAQPGHENNPECKYLAITSVLELRTKSAVYKDLTAYMRENPNATINVSPTLTSTTYFCAAEDADPAISNVPYELAQSRCGELQALLNDYKSRSNVPSCVDAHIDAQLLGPNSFCGKILAKQSTQIGIASPDVRACTWPTVPTNFFGFIDDAIANRQTSGDGDLVRTSPTFFYPEDEITDEGFFGLFKRTTVQPVNCFNLTLTPNNHSCPGGETCSIGRLSATPEGLCDCPAGQPPVCANPASVACGTLIFPTNGCGACTALDGQPQIGRQCTTGSTCLPKNYFGEGEGWGCYDDAGNAHNFDSEPIVRKYVYHIQDQQDAGILYSSLEPQLIGTRYTYPGLTTDSADIATLVIPPNRRYDPTLVTFTPINPGADATLYSVGTANLPQHTQTEAMILKFTTDNEQTCTTSGNKNGKTGPLFAPAIKLEWDWTKIDEKTCSPGGEAVFCDTAQFLMSTSYRLALIDTALKNNDLGKLNKLLVFNAFLYKDGYSPDARADFVATAGGGKLGAKPPALFNNGNFTLAAYWSPKTNPASENLFFELPDHAGDPNTLVRPGLYHVQINLRKPTSPLLGNNQQATSGQAVTITLTELSTDRPLYALYELPLDGPLGTDAATGEPRNGYGFAIDGVSEDLQLEGANNLLLSDYDSSKPALAAITIDAIKTWDERKNLESQNNRDGLLFEYDLQNQTVAFAPSQATPLLLHAFPLTTTSTATNNPTSGRLIYGYRINGVETGSINDARILWHPYAAKERGPTGACMIGDDPAKTILGTGTTQGVYQGELGTGRDIYYRAIAYAPLSDKYNLVPNPTTGSAGGSQPNVQEYLSPAMNSRRDKQNQVSLDFSRATKNWKSASLSDMIELVKTGKGCIVDDPFTTQIYWNKNALDQELANKNAATPPNNYDLLDSGIRENDICRVELNAQNQGCPADKRIALQTVVGGTGCPVGQIVQSGTFTQTGCTLADYGYICNDTGACQTKSTIYKGIESCNLNTLASNRTYGATCSNAPLLTEPVGFACNNPVAPTWCTNPKSIYEVTSGAAKFQIAGTQNYAAGAATNRIGYACGAQNPINYVFEGPPQGCPAAERIPIYRVTGENTAQNCFVNELTTLTTRSGCGTYEFAGYACQTAGHCASEAQIFQVNNDSPSKGTLSLDGGFAGQGTSSIGYICTGDTPPVECKNPKTVYSGLVNANAAILGTTSTLRGEPAVRKGFLCNP